MKFIIGAIICGAGAFFPFLLIDDNEGDAEYEV